MNMLLLILAVVIIIGLLCVILVLLCDGRSSAEVAAEQEAADWLDAQALVHKEGQNR